MTVTILIHQGLGEIPETQSSMGSAPSGGNAQVLLLREEFYSASCNSVDHVQSSGGRLKKWVWGQRHNPCLSCQCSWASSALTEGMNRLRHKWISLSPSGWERIFYLSQWCKGGNWHDINQYPTLQGLFLQVFCLICLKPQLATTQRWVCHGHPLVMGAHPLCTWAILM